MKILNDQIRNELDRIERNRGVRVLYAAEAGSRAWGLGSRDSGREVRFICARAGGRSLENLEAGPVEETISPTLALSGWDLRTALQRLGESSPVLLDWIKSPIVYRADPAFALRLGLLASEFHSPKRSFLHYLHRAGEHYRSRLQQPIVLLKDHLVALRPLLACLWIERRLGPVPAAFQALVETLVEDVNLRFHIATLVARKRAGGDSDPGQRIPIVCAFLESELERLERIVPVDASEESPPAGLGEFFRAFGLEEAA